MAAKPKAKPKPKPKMTDKRQSERFIAAAQKLQTDENPEAFEQVFRKIVPPKPRPPRRSST